MKTSTCRQSLEAQIEQLVRAELADIQASVAAAVARALTSPGSGSRARAPRPARAQAQGKRRTREEVAALEEQLLAAVTATPGETMKTLAPQLDSTPRELSLPAARLKRAGRLRSVGQRHRTKYFPATAVAAQRA